MHVEVTGLDARPRLLLPLPRRQLDQPGRPHPHRARPRRPDLASCSSPPSPARRTTTATSRRYQHLADEDLDVVFHLGDYLYEYAVNAVGGARNYTDRTLPAHFNRETITLEDYRLRYALYKCDPDLRAAHAAHPFVVTWDDHETENNYADDIAENDVPPEEFLLRRAAAYRAYWENQPLRSPQQPDGPDMRLYRRLHVRAARPVRHPRHPPVPLRPGVRRRLAGPRARVRGPGAHPDRRRRRSGGCSTAGGVHRPLERRAAAGHLLPAARTSPRAATSSPWTPGTATAASRERVLAGRRRRASRTSSSSPATSTSATPSTSRRTSTTRRPGPLGAEFVTTSIASGKDGADKPANWDTYLAANPHLKFYNGRRGYVTVTLDGEQARADFRTVSAVTTPGAPVTTAASFVTEAGNPGLQQV